MTHLEMLVQSDGMIGTTRRMLSWKESTLMSMELSRQPPLPGTSTLCYRHIWALQPESYMSIKQGLFNP